MVLVACRNWRAGPPSRVMTPVDGPTTDGEAAGRRRPRTRASPGQAGETETRSACATCSIRCSPEIRSARSQRRDSPEPPARSPPPRPVAAPRRTRAGTVLGLHPTGRHRNQTVRTGCCSGGRDRMTRSTSTGCGSISRPSMAASDRYARGVKQTVSITSTKGRTPEEVAKDHGQQVEVRGGHGGQEGPAGRGPRVARTNRVSVWRSWIFQCATRRRCAANRVQDFDELRENDDLPAIADGIRHDLQQLHEPHRCARSDGQVAGPSHGHDLVRQFPKRRPCCVVAVQRRPHDRGVVVDRARRP